MPNYQPHRIDSLFEQTMLLGQLPGVMNRFLLPFMRLELTPRLAWLALALPQNLHPCLCARQ
jgi:hypothetical protein